MNEQTEAKKPEDTISTYHGLKNSDAWVTFEEAEGILGLKKRAIQYKIKEFGWEKRQPLYNGRQVTFLLKSQLYDYVKNDRNQNVSHDFSKEAGEQMFTPEPVEKKDLTNEEKIALQAAVNKDLVPFLDGYNNLFRRYTELNEKRLAAQSTIAEKDSEILKREKRIVAYKSSLIFIIIILSLIGSYFGYKNYELNQDIQSYDAKIKLKDTKLSELQNKNDKLKDALVTTQSKHAKEYIDLYDKLSDTREREGVNKFSIDEFRILRNK